MRLLAYVFPLLTGLYPVCLTTACYRLSRCMLLCTVYGAPLRWNKASELQCSAWPFLAQQTDSHNTTQDLFQRCRDLDKMIDFLALVTLMGHLDGCSRIYRKPFQSESHYFFQSVLLMSA